MAAQTLGFTIDNGLDNTGLRLWRARAFKRLGRFDEALADCDAASSFSPDDMSILWLRAGLLMSMGRDREALEAVASLGARTGSGTQMPGDEASLQILRASTAFREGRWKEAASAALSVLRQGAHAGGAGSSGRGKAAFHAIVAESLRALGQPERARPHAERAIEGDPDSPELRISLALILWDQGDYKGALAASEAARLRGAEPGEADYLALLSRSQLDDNTSPLVPLLQDLLRKKTRRGEEPDPRLLFALGKCLYHDERPDLARVWFEKVLALVPTHELSRLYLISVAESLEEDEPCTRAYEAYLDLFPDNSAIRRDFAEFLASRERWKKAETLLEKGLAYAEPTPGTKRMLARAYRENGKYRDASLIYRDLLREDPENGELLMALCLCLSRDGKSEYAVALLESAPLPAMESAGPWIVKGILAGRLGRTESAVEALHKACELEPRHPRPWRELSRLYSSRGLDAFAAEARSRAEALEAGSSRGKKNRKSSIVSEASAGKTADPRGPG
jgi:tetratricopeptide (TPR) repeat protein